MLLLDGVSDFGVVAGSSVLALEQMVLLLFGVGIDGSSTFGAGADGSSTFY